MSNGNVQAHAWDRQSIQRYAWLLILIFAALVRFYRLEWAALWFDESFSFVLSSHAIVEIPLIAANDIHPPLYYVVLHLWMSLFGSGLFSIRALSAVAGVISVGLGVWLTALVTNRRAALIAGILLALLPIAVRYSHEVRMYALMGVWMTGAVIALVYWVKAPKRKSYLAVYAVLVAAGLYTHYFAILLVITHWLYLLILYSPSGGNGGRLIFKPDWWIANVAAGMMFLPWLPTLIEQLGNASDLQWIQPLTLGSVVSVFWQYLILNNGTDLPSLVFWALIPAILAVSAYCIAQDEHPTRFSGLLTLHLWAPLLIIVIVSMQFPLLIARYFLFTALALPMLLGVALDRLAREHCRLAAGIFVAFIGIELVGMNNLYGMQDHTKGGIRPTQERIDIVADVINDNYRPGDQIIVLNYFWFSSLAFYNTTSGRPRLYAPELTTVDGKCVIYCRLKAPYGLQDNDLYAASLDILPPGSTRVWLVDGVDDNDQSVSIPSRWQLSSTLATGDNRLRLYETDGAKPSSHE